MPVAMFASSVVLAALTPWADGHLSRILDPYPSVSGQSVSTAVSIIAGAMITLSGLTFTAIASAMSTGLTALSVRVVPMLQQDRVMRLSLGMFTATFGYCLITAVSIAIGEDDYQPVLATFAVVVLALVAGFCFIALVVRVCHHLNPATLLGNIARAGQHGLTGHVSQYRGRQPNMRVRHDRHHDDNEILVCADHGRHHKLTLLAVNSTRLRQCERDWQLGITLLVSVGSAVPDRMPILAIAGTGPLTSKRRKLLIGSLAFGESYSPRSGPVGAVRTMVDIALKALSPAVNDPTRAAQVIDELENFLVQIAKSALPSEGPTLARGWGRDWEDYVSLATDEIRQFGTTSVQIQRRLRAMFISLIAILPSEQHPPLKRRLANLEQGIDRWWASPLDRVLASASDPQGLGSPAGGDGADP